MKIKHESTQAGTGVLTVGQLLDLAEALAAAAPDEAAVWIRTQDSQRDGTSWDVRAVWEDGSGA